VFNNETMLQFEAEPVLENRRALLALKGT